jgi:hypothetical protein
MYEFDYTPKEKHILRVHELTVIKTFPDYKP